MAIGTASLVGGGNPMSALGKLGGGKHAEFIKAHKAKKAKRMDMLFGRKPKKNEEEEVPMHGEGSHEGGASPVGAPEAVDGAEAGAAEAVVDTAPTKYSPFKMPASVQGNSPITKNFGSKEQRGFSTPAKMSDMVQTNMPDKVSKKSGVLYKGGGTGSSPAKGWFSNIAKKVGGFAKKAIGMTPIGMAGKALFGKKGNQAESPDPAAAVGAAAENAAASGGGGATQPHGDEMHTGEGAQATAGAEGEGVQSQDPTQMMKMQKLKMKKRSQLSGMGGFGSSMGATLFSDVRLKEKVEKAGKSPSGIPIYEFNYIGDNRRYKGTMAQDLIHMGIDAVETHESGYYMVDYSKIDVNMKLIN